MFKAGISSYLLPQWFKKTSTTTKPASNSKEPIPSEFVIPSLENENKLINVSMNENDEFIDIQYKHLTYAEAASLSKHKQQTATKNPSTIKKETDKGVAELGSAKESAYIDNQPEASEILEPFKSDINYRKSKQFKNRQFESTQKKRTRKNLEKQSLKKNK